MLFVIFLYDGDYSVVSVLIGSFSALTLLVWSSGL